MNEVAIVDRMKQDEEQFVTELVESKGANLPANVQDVVKVFEFTDLKARAWKMASDKMAKLEDQQEAYHSALRSGQNWGIAALYAQKRMGEITGDMPTKERGAARNDTGTAPKRATLAKEGINYHTYQDAERIASNPEVLDRVIETAKTSNEIPTRTAVLREIRAERAKQMREEASQDASIHNERVMERKVKERPKVVANYFDSIKRHREMAELALASAKRGMFSDESINILRKKHQELATLHAQIEAAVEGDKE